MASQEEKDGSPTPPKPVEEEKVDKMNDEKAASPSKVPDWILNNITDTHSLKMLLRCWLASWATFILILPSASLRVLGQAAFFASLLTFMIPANMPASLFLLANLMIVVGSCIGWAWSSAGMAASLRARSQVLLQAQLQKTKASIAGATNPDQLFQVAIFNGDFLDVRSTAVFGVFIVFGAYFAGIAQAKLPKLKIASIFLLIITDVMCSYGPLFPFAQYTLATTFMIPIGCSVAISLACQFFIFPETLNTAWQLNLIKMFGVARKTIGLHQSTMERMLHEDPDVVEAETDPKIRAMQAGMIQLAEAMGGQRPFLELEVSYGRLSGKDLSQLYTELRVMLVRLFGLNAFFHLLERDALSNTEDKGPVSLQDTHAILRFRQLLAHTEADQHVGLDSLLPVLIEAARRPIKAVDACFEATSNWLQESVQRRGSYKHDDWIRRLEEAHAEMREAMESFSQQRLRLIEPYKDLFHDQQSHLSPETQLRFRNSARPLFICLVFGANLTHLAEEVIRAHGVIINLAKRRSKNRLWFPTGLRKLGNILVSKRPVMGTSNKEEVLANLNNYEDHAAEDEREEHDAASQETKVGDTPDKDSSETRANRAGRVEPRDPDALPPTNLLHRIVRFVAGCYQFFWSPTSVFGLRFAVVTFALWLPAVIPSSAGFVYHNRGLWALIMGQTGMALSGGELVFSLVGRLAGTLLGLILGMLYWYMSCGLAAHGNPYGLAAVCAVGWIPIVFLRLFAPPIFILPAIMLGVTTVLCTGYSWIDGNLPVLANSGIGYNLAWKRALLVVVGMAACFVVTLFPRPPSTREQVRLGFAQSTESIQRLYALIVESWIVIEAHDEEEAPRQEKVKASLRSRFLAAQGVLGGLHMSVGLAPLDLSCRGPWPKDKYEELLKIHARLLEAISQMSSALHGLDLAWRRKMLHTTAILDPKTISDISMTLSLLANTMKTGAPLPHASTLLLESTIRNQSVTRQVERAIEARRGTLDDLLTLETISDPQFMKHTAAVMALVTFVRQLDRLRAVVRDLVGEVDLPGYDELKRHHDQRVVQAYMPDSQA